MVRNAYLTGCSLILSKVEVKKMIPEIDDKTIEIGNKITTTMALELCKHYGFGHLVSRIEEDRGAFKEWTFDGASMIPDALFSEIFHIPSLTEIALKHDLKYAYGEIGNKEEKSKADKTFKEELINDGSWPKIAHLMFMAVDIFGDGPVKTRFSWGFARK
jgi:hypothetical protein